MADDDASTRGGRVFFSNTERSLMEEDVIELTSVGVDIGSSTSHLAFSTLTLERLDSRYVIVEREVAHQSDIMLTPYATGETIDADALGKFIDQVFETVGMARDDIDTGALILTGVAVRRQNARAVAELFSDQAGKFVAVSAGDALETVMAAHGSGAVARSEANGETVMNIDIGGGTSKIALCRAGEVAALTALDVGARLFVFDEAHRLQRIEAAGHRFAAECGFEPAIGDVLQADQMQALASRMADRLFEAISAENLSTETKALLRTEPLGKAGKPDVITFSGGVSEFIYENSEQGYGDLGPLLAREVRHRIDDWGVPVEAGLETIRATVIGASQYTVQVSGGTIFLSEPDVVPIRNVAVIAPALGISENEIDAKAVSTALKAELRKMDLDAGHQPVAVCLKWSGSASYARLDGLTSGLIDGMAGILTEGHPLVLVTDGDIGGLLGIHCREELGLESPIVSVDGIELNAFDYIDIGDLLKQTGAVPVVIKSLVFPGETQADAQPKKAPQGDDKIATAS